MTRGIRSTRQCRRHWCDPSRFARVSSREAQMEELFANLGLPVAEAPAAQRALEIVPASPAPRDGGAIVSGMDAKAATLNRACCNRCAKVIHH